VLQLSKKKIYIKSKKKINHVHETTPPVSAGRPIRSGARDKRQEAAAAAVAAAAT
jgi:hypothetical protein